MYILDIDRFVGEWLLWQYAKWVRGGEKWVTCQFLPRKVHSWTKGRLYNGLKRMSPGRCTEGGGAGTWTSTNNLISTSNINIQMFFLSASCWLRLMPSSLQKQGTQKYESSASSHVSNQKPGCFPSMRFLNNLLHCMVAKFVPIWNIGDRLWTSGCCCCITSSKWRSSVFRHRSMKYIPQIHAWHA